MTGWRTPRGAVAVTAMKMFRVSRRSVLLGSAALALAGPAHAVQQSASERLRRLFARSDEAELKRNPVSRLSRGDFSQADKLGQPFSDAHDSQGRHNALKDLAELARIDRSALTPDEQVSYDVFRWQRDLERRGLTGAVLKADQAMAINHFYGIHAAMAQLQLGPGRGALQHGEGLRRRAEATHPDAGRHGPRGQAAEARRARRPGAAKADHEQRARAARRHDGAGCAGVRLLRSHQDLPRRGPRRRPDAACRGLHQGHRRKGAAGVRADP